MNAKWDQRFMALAAQVASWSRDPSTQCGSVIVRPDQTIASVGYNGFPRGCDDDPEIYADRPRKYSRVVHAEVNAIVTACEPLNGYTLYVTPLPTCDRCAGVIIQAGIARVVSPPSSVERWSEATESAAQMYREVGMIWDIRSV